MLAHRQFWDGKQPRMVRFPAEPDDRLMSPDAAHPRRRPQLLPDRHPARPARPSTMGDWRRAVVEPVMEAFQPTMVASFPRTFVELATGELPIEGGREGALLVQHRRRRALRPHPPPGRSSASGRPG